MRKYGPKVESHPTVGKVCTICQEPFKVGDYTTLLPMGPADLAEAVKADLGLAYTAVAEEVHYDCAFKIQENS